MSLVRSIDYRHKVNMRTPSLISLAPVFALSLFLTGCVSSFDPLQSSTPQTSPLGAIRGSVYGGRNAIIGAHVYVLAVGAGAPVSSVSTGGYGGNGIAASTANASSSLLTNSNAAGYQTVQDGNGNWYVTSDSLGNFGLSGEYTCVQNTQVYLYAVGGNTGGGTANSGAGLMAVLGNCPSTGTLAAQTPFVYMNEVSTIAAAYALAGYATDPLHISSSSTSLAKTGVANAAANANQMFTVTKPTQLTGGAGANTTTPGSGTNGGTGTVPYQEINTLSNIIAACVNTTSPTSANCLTLFRNATSDGTVCATTCATEPSDTAAAAINIAHHPASNVSTLYGLVGGTAAPYTPALTSTPVDFAVRLTFTGGGITNLDGQPQALAVDASGNLWSVGYFGTVLSKFSPLGVPANTSGFALSLNGPSTVAIDANSTHVWISNFATDSGDGFLSSYNISAGTVSAHIAAGGNSSTAPIALGIDGSGNIWVSNYDGNNSTASNVVKMNSGGTILSTVSQASVSKITSPVWMAFEPGATGNTWIANEDANGAALFLNSGAYSSSSALGSQHEAQSAAVDSGNNVWFTNLNGNNLSKLNAAGTTGSSFALGIPAGDLTSVSSLAIDGAGNVFAVNNSQNSLKPVDNALFEVTNAGVALGPTNGYPSSPTTLCPGAVVVDGSGNVWYQTNVTDGQNAALASGTLVEMVGLGVPVVTPLSYGVANTFLGTRP